MLYQAAIVIGCLTSFAVASRFRWPSLIKLSGASFFVYLIHEFPLRAVVARISEMVLDRSTSCWVVSPIVIFVCYAFALLLSKHCTRLFQFMTGGRTPASAARVSASTERNVLAVGAKN